SHARPQGRPAVEVQGRRGRRLGPRGEGRLHARRGGVEGAPPGTGSQGQVVAMMTTHWKLLTPSQFEHERRALDFVRARLPDHEPYRAWANFEFTAGDGALYDAA